MEYARVTFIEAKSQTKTTRKKKSNNVFEVEPQLVKHQSYIAVIATVA